MKRAPLPFTRFVSEVLGVRLTAGQSALARVAYDGCTFGMLTGAERDLARTIFGDLESIPNEARDVIVAVCGARAGKSYVLCALRLLHLALTVPVHTLAPGEQATALIVAPDLRLARQTLRYAHGAAKACETIAARIRHEGPDGFTVAREDGRAVAIECLPATRGGSAVRGRTFVGAVLDECAFFRDDDYAINDVEVFRAVAPRVLPEGQIILASTPWAEGVGLLHQLFANNHGRPTTALAAHAPTTLLRDDARTRGMVERERERDPENAAREFDAQFMTSGAGLFFDSSAIEASIASITEGASDSGIVSVGADFGFERDSSTIAVACLSGQGVVHVAETLELRPRKGAPLVPSAVARQFAEIAKRHHSKEILADLHAFEAMSEHMSAHGVRLVAAASGVAAKVESYTRARTTFHEGRVRLPNDRRLVAQLKAVTCKLTASRGLAISSPRKAGGGHGDLVSAVVLAIGALPSTANASSSSRLFDSSIKPLFPMEVST